MSTSQTAGVQRSIRLHSGFIVTSAAIGAAGVLGCAAAYFGPALVGLLVAGLLALWLALVRPGLALGILWLAALNGIPLVNIQSGIGQFKPTDIAVASLVFLASARSGVAPRARAERIPRLLGLACGLFAAWWFVTFVHSIYTGIPAVDAFFDGRDLLWLAIGVPAAWVVLREPRAWRDCVLTISIGAGIYSVAYVAGALGLVNATTFTHPTLILNFGSVQRIYTPMNDLVIAVAVFSTSVLVTTRVNRMTPAIALLAATTLLAFFLQLTRAAYLSMALGAFIGLAVAITRGTELRRRLTVGAGVTFAVVGVFFFSVIALGSRGVPTNVVSQRISSGLSAVNEGSGTVGYRINLYHRMLAILGPDWPVGLGFLHPKDRYFPDLPEGNIRNSDVGLLNAVMTMGVIGLLLLYGVLGAAARHVAVTRRRRPSWLVVGLFGWLAVLLAGSPTLVTLFSATGIITTALTLVLCCVDTPPLGLPTLDSR